MRRYRDFEMNGSKYKSGELFQNLLTAFAKDYIVMISNKILSTIAIDA
jgi:hypothetical protein